MRSRNAILTASVLALAFAADGVLAAPFDSPDPRSFAMGGTGVAAGTSDNASFLNPALLAMKRDRSRLSIGLPIVSARLLEQGDVIDAIDDFDESNPIGQFEDALDAFNEGDMNAARQGLIDAGNGLISSLESISDKLLHIEGNAAVAVAMPGEGLGVSVFANSHILGGALGSFSEEDRDQIQQVIDAAAGSNAIPDPVDDFTSSMRAVFMVLTEVGVSFAHKFDGLGGFAVGVTPKLLKVETYDYSFVGNEIDDIDIDIDQGKRSDSDFNIDVGIARDFGLGWQAGVTVKNLISREYTTAAGNRLKLEPMARAGIVHQPPFMSWITLAADVDLTENQPAGFDNKSRYLGLGAEFNLLRTLQLRVGYRRNLSELPSDLDENLYSAGVGFSPLGVHLDLALAGNSNDIGGAMRLGFRF